MAAASGTMVIINKDGSKNTISMYLNDTAANLVRFDESKVAVAGSVDTYYPKKSGYLVDICLTSDIATPTHLQILRNSTPTGDIVDATAQLASVVSRPRLGCGYNPGDKLTIMQIP